MTAVTNKKLIKIYLKKLDSMPFNNDRFIIIGKALEIARKNGLRIIEKRLEDDYIYTSSRILDGKIVKNNEKNE